MLIESANFKLKLEEILKVGSISSSNETEEKVIWLAKKWISGTKSFKFKSSGSTGKAKEYQIQREKIVQSTEATFLTIDPGKDLKNTLLCINPDFIGGSMVVFRALIMNLNLYIIEPTIDVISQLPPDYQTDLTSMVPLQFKNLRRADLERFKTILIGGAPIELNEKLSSSTIYSTYGMTETVSHVALRKIQEPKFTTVGDTQVALGNSDCLRFKGEITDHKWLQTNDIGEVYSNRSFKWIGRKDFIINSGGIKINPENIENKLAEQLPNSEFVITSLPDFNLGEKVVLLINAKLKHDGLNFDHLEKYERPKQVFDNFELITTDSGKIDRIKTREKLLDSIK